MRALLLALFLFAGALGAQPVAPWRVSTPEERRLDAAAFAGLEREMASLADVQSLVVVVGGRTAFQYYRDEQPEALRDTQSVTKSALAALVGIALRQGHIASIDKPVVELVPQWRPLQADPRAQEITLRHLLSMTAGFSVSDRAGVAPPLAPEQAWARPLRAAPGQSFAYDNSIVPLVAAILEKATGQPLADYAREHLVRPLGMEEPAYRGVVHLRTVDMAKLGHLFLQDGAWNGSALLVPGFAKVATQSQSRGGPPVELPYGLFWWVASGNTFFASGYGGQFIWVHQPMDLVVAVTSFVSAGSQQRGHALRLIRGPVFQAVQNRLASTGR